MPEEFQDLRAFGARSGLGFRAYRVQGYGPKWIQHFPLQADRGVSKLSKRRGTGLGGGGSSHYGL